VSTPDARRGVAYTSRAEEYAASLAGYGGYFAAQNSEAAVKTRVADLDRKVANASAELDTRLTARKSELGKVEDALGEWPRRLAG
jgi:hypothetical protein